MEPVNHWRPVTAEYQVELMPSVEVLPSSRKRRTRTEAAQEAARREDQAPLVVTGIQWFYFFQGCAYFVLGSVLLSYPSSQSAAWLVAHSSILTPFKIAATGTAPLINLLAETFFILSIISAVIGVMWLMRSVLARWITIGFAGASLARIVLYFVALKGATPTILLSMHQREALLTGAVLNLLIASYLVFYSGAEQEPGQPA